MKIADASVVSFDKTDVELMLAAYTAKGLDAGTYHKDGEHWETCDCLVTTTPGGENTPENGGENTPENGAE